MSEVTPGMHNTMYDIIFKDHGFNENEINITKRFSQDWYVTTGGSQQEGKSNYKFFLIKPTRSIEELIGINKEILVILSRYTNFEPRVLDAYDLIAKLFSEQRIEKMCYILIADTDNLEKSLKESNSNPESQIIVPLTYSEVLNSKTDDYYFRNKFRKYFYTRDLFDYSDPLKKDVFYFGRTELVNEIIDKHKQMQNSGLFGLRKTGKTSIIYDVLRKLPLNDSIGIYVDCQDTAFHQKRWYGAVGFLVHKILEATNSLDEYDELRFTEEGASTSFKWYMELVKTRFKKKILLLFDEIENITFEKSPSSHWNQGLDFIYFWQTIRSVYQQNDELFTFCIIGTNPRSVEISTFKGADNPLFNIVLPKFISGFDLQLTREMVKKLGRPMGIKFEENVYAMLLQDYGGHPFLIRRICSRIASLYQDRPVQIDRNKYNKAKEIFNKENDYFSMILDVLTQFYFDEYEMLMMLANDQRKDFLEFANADYSYVKHLLGYGIIKENDGEYDFTIDAIKDYLIKQGKRPNFKTKEEKWTELTTKRNNMELELRKVVRNILRVAYKNETEAKLHVIEKIYGGEQKSKYITYSYNELFDSNKSEIYLKKLVTLIRVNWTYFSEYFGDQNYFNYVMEVLCTTGRNDAHASIPDYDEMQMFLSAIRYIEKGIDCYKSNNF